MMDKLVKITRLVGGALEIDFGELGSYEYINSKNKKTIIDRGVYRLHFFDCAWRFMQRQTILFSCYDYVNESFILSNFTNSDIYLESFVDINDMDCQLIFSKDIKIDIFPMVNNISKPIYLLTDVENKEVNISKVLCTKI